jgi:hypothetical protein
MVGRARSIDDARWIDRDGAIGLNADTTATSSITRRPIMIEAAVDKIPTELKYVWLGRGVLIDGGKEC